MALVALLGVACDPVSSLDGLLRPRVAFGNHGKLADGRYDELRTVYASGQALVFAKDEERRQVVFRVSDANGNVEIPRGGRQVPHCTFEGLGGELRGASRLSPPFNGYDVFHAGQRGDEEGDPDAVASDLRAFVLSDWDEATRRGTLHLVDMRCEEHMDPMEGVATGGWMGVYFVTRTNGGEVVAIHGGTGETQVVASDARVVLGGREFAPSSLQLGEWTETLALLEGDTLTHREVSSARPGEFVVTSRVGPGVTGARVWSLKEAGEALRFNIQLDLDGDVVVLDEWPELGADIADSTVRRVDDACSIPVVGDALYSASTFDAMAYRAPCDEGESTLAVGAEGAGFERPLPVGTAHVVRASSGSYAASAPRGEAGTWWWIGDETPITERGVDLVESFDAGTVLVVEGREPGTLDLIEWNATDGADVVLRDVVARNYSASFVADVEDGVGDAYERIVTVTTEEIAGEGGDEPFLRYDFDVSYERVARGVPTDWFTSGPETLGVEAWFENSDGVSGDLRFRYYAVPELGLDVDTDWFDVVAERVLPDGVAFLDPDEGRAEAWPRGALVIHDWDREARAGTMSILDVDSGRLEEPSVEGVRDLETLFSDVFFAKVDDDEPGLYVLDLPDFAQAPWLQSVR